MSACFSLELLNADYCKRVSKDKRMAEVAINNDVDGLCSYLTAPNIRNKIRHPLFLTLKFSSCVFLYYSGTHFQHDNVRLIPVYSIA